METIAPSGGHAHQWWQQSWLLTMGGFLVNSLQRECSSVDKTPPESN
jgi:hypothetical protein